MKARSLRHFLTTRHRNLVMTKFQAMMRAGIVNQAMIKQIQNLMILVVTVKKVLMIKLWQTRDLMVPAAIVIQVMKL